MCSGRSGAKSNAAPIVCVWLVVTEGGGGVRGVAENQRCACALRQAGLTTSAALQLAAGKPSVQVGDNAATDRN
jgi:hypothetical protein